MGSPLERNTVLDVNPIDSLYFLHTVFLATVVCSCATLFAGADELRTPKCFARTVLFDLSGN